MAGTLARVGAGGQADHCFALTAGSARLRGRERGWMIAMGMFEQWPTPEKRIMIWKRMFSIGMRTHVFVLSTAMTLGAALLTCLSPPLDAGPEPENVVVGRSPEDTLSVNCHEGEKPKRVLSPVAISEDDKWSAYVEVTVQSDLGCLNTSRLWVAKKDGQYRLVYLIPPKRDNAANGMKIVGWAPDSSLILVQTEQWQYGSDAPDTQQVLAINAGTGEVYEPELQSLLQDRKDERCAFRVIDAGFSSDRNVVILIRAKFFTAVEVDETEADAPLAKRCANREETWSFNYANGETKRVSIVEPLHVFRKFLPNNIK